MRKKDLAWPIPEDADMDPYWDAEQDAMTDQTYTESGYIASWQWGIALEDPTTEKLYSYVCGN